jgi:hypothetical protein
MQGACKAELWKSSVMPLMYPLVMAENKIGMEHLKHRLRIRPDRGAIDFIGVLQQTLKREWRIVELR